MFASIVWYLGLMLAIAGSLLIIRPSRWLRVPTRRRASIVAMSGIGLCSLVFLTSGSLTRIATATMLLDATMPAFQFNEVHEVDVAASAGRTYRAIFEVTPDEISFFRALTWIRRFGRSGPPSILNPPGGQPLLETALRSSFRKAGERTDEELVLASFVIMPASALTRVWSAEAFRTLDEPGFVKTAMNFRIEPRDGSHVVLRTETRCFATDATTRRFFTIYWRTIYPGSAIIRREWLRAIKARAER